MDGRYEYVPKSEYAPVRRELEKIINRVQRIMRTEYGATFQYQLIGSGRRHLVTRVKNGNEGYDFDYNLIIPHPDEGYRYKADVVKQEFMAAFKIGLKGTSYSFPKDSTSAITIKVVDTVGKRIRHSCDFAVVYYEDINNGYYYLRNNKKQRAYEFAFRSMNFDIDEKVSSILEEGGWNHIRDEYLKLKNRNKVREKHSYSLYIEAVNNVFNQMFNAL